VIKKIGVLVAVFLFATPAVSYFKYRRHAEPPTSTGQHYIVVDETFWLHSRPDLSDIRLYAAEKEIPYQITIESGGVESEQKQFRVLQPASVGGKTQFALDMSGVPEYDRIKLKLATKNFVAHARVEGQDDLHGNHWALLGVTTLYDLTDEKLGDNSTLQIPLSAFKYLRVTVDSSVKPADVENGTAGVTRAEKAVWREVGSVAKQEQQGKDTVLTFSIPANTPVDRLALQIDPAQGNFRRQIDIRGPQEQSFSSGEISRIHMQRNGQKVDVQQTSLDLCGNCQNILKAVIHNGDDTPLRITTAHLLQMERRIYFDSGAALQPWIYYGDEKLGRPEYDYPKLFQKEKTAAPVTLGVEELNAAYSGRPDSRPWSERHPAILWIAIIAAVLILGGVAIRSLKTTANST
jgi:hypothetical protein